MPEAAIAPAPTAPTPAPAPAPTPTPAPDSSNFSKPNLNNAFSRLDEMMNEPEPADKSAAKPADAKAKAPEIQLDKKADKPAEPAKPEKAATLRENYDKLKTQLAEREQELAKIKSERAKPVDDPEKKQLSEKLTAREKRLLEVENELKFSKFESTDDYKRNYLKPFADAWEEGKKISASMKIADGATGEVRQATAQDFDTVMSISDSDAAAAKIEELFGTGVKAQMVIDARREVLRANQKRINAIEDFRKQGAEREKTLSETASTRQAETVKMWKDAVNEAVEKYPFFKPVEGDERGNTMLSEGMALSDLAFGALGPDAVEKLPKNVQALLVEGKLPPQELVKLHSAIRNKAGAFDREAHKNKALTAELKELKSKLEEYEKSEPGKGAARKVEGGGSPFMSADEMIDKLAGSN